MRYLVIAPAMNHISFLLRYKFYWQSQSNKNDINKQINRSSITILNKNNLLVELVLSRDINFVMMEIITLNNSENTMDQYVFQVS